MGHIEGNTKAYVQVKSTVPDEYAIDCLEWRDAFPEPLSGFLDLADAGTSACMMKRVEDSDYIFLCDYFDLHTCNGKLSTENSRMLIDGEIYEVRLYDDVMGLHEHMEIYLKYLGGQGQNGDGLTY